METLYVLQGNYTMFVNDSPVLPKDNVSLCSLHRTGTAHLSAHERCTSPALVSAPRTVNTGTINFSSDLWSTSDVILDASALDWLTLTTRSSAAFEWAAGLLSVYTSGDVRPMKQLQYSGSGSDGWFVGIAQQWDYELDIMRSHYMVRVSGSVAHRFFVAARGDKSTRYLEHFKATRIDVQYTAPSGLPVDYRLADLAPLLEAAEWSGRPGPRPAVSAFRGSDGLDTLYIGTRSKGYRRLTRIYTKQVGGQILPRFETEYKEELAADLWEKLLSDDVFILGGLLAREVAIIPLQAVADELFRLLAFSSSEQVRIKIRRTQKTLETTLRWLHSSVLPALRRVQSVGDERVAAWVSGFLDHVARSEAIELAGPPGLSYDFFVSA